MKIINLINQTKFDQFMTDYQTYKISKNDEYKNFEDHLEGILILNDKVGAMMD